MSEQEYFQEIIESNPMELRTNLFEGCSPDLVNYAHALRAYRMGEISDLKRISNEIKCTTILAIVKLRIKIRERLIASEDLIDYSQILPVIESQWIGEYHFVLAMAYEIIGDQQQAKVSFLKSYQEFENIGFRKKAIKALLNATAANSRVFPDGKYIADYQFILQKSLEVGELGVAGIALTNISREYQMLGALNLALDYCDRALLLLGTEANTLQYDLILAHRAHLLTQLDRRKEAELCLEHLRTSEFLEVEAALKVLEEKDLAEKAVDLLPTWRERQFEKEKPEFGELEEHLIQILSGGPKTRSEIISKLYGDKIDSGALENRFFNLLNRIKKKCPGLIKARAGSYYLEDRSFLVSMRLAK